MKKILLTALCFIPTLLFGQMTINTLSSFDATCNGNCDGTADIQVTGGTTPIVLTILNGLGTETIVQTNDSTWQITALCAGNWNIEVADALPSTVATSVLISEPTLLTVSTPSVVDVSCFGICDGSATLIVLGGVAPYAYIWSDGSTTQNLFGACAGTYSYTVVDANGCEVNGSVTTLEPSQIYTDEVLTQPSCIPGCDGIIDLSTAFGGTTPYQYDLNGITAGPVFPNICAGSHFAIITDANGCIGTTIIEIGVTITSTNTYTQSTCGMMDGAVSPAIAGGQTPYNYAWTGPNGFTSTNQNISGLDNGTYDLTITDANSCTGTSPANVTDVPGSGITGNITSQDANCGDGNASISFSQGLAPYNVSWSNGDNSVTISNLNAGSYTVYFEDANGCNNTLPFTIADLGGGNCSSINGYVFNDVNSTCLFDGVDTYLQGRIVTANPGNYIATTDANGYYEFNIPFGNYTVNRAVSNGYTIVCNPTGTNITTSVGAPSIPNIDFGDSLNIVADASVAISGNNVRPQLSTSHYLYLQNYSSTSIAGELKYLMDTSMTFTTSTPAPDAVNGDTLIWNIAPFNNSNANMLFAIYGVGPTAPLGTPVQQCAWFISSQTETTLINNSVCHDQIVTGSFDPNDKAVFPEGDIRIKDSTLEYLIRFQNTGTDTAFTVLITDTISHLLDLSSFQLKGSTHPVTYQITNSNVLEFTFNNILLPDSNVNESGSHGSVIFSIQQNYSNIIGDTIENTANIYFDFNAPVTTNTTVSPIVPKQFDVTSTSQNVSCFGDCNGNVSVTATGDEPPFLILWDDSNASTTNAVDSLCFGTYTVRVIDAEDDTIFQTVDIIEPNTLTISSTTVDDINNTCQGQATVTPSGGSGTYTYLWDAAAGSQTTATATGLCGATYNVTVIDSLGCNTTETVTVLNSLDINENQFAAFVAPNPFTDKFTLKLNGEFEKISVINILGEVVRTVQTNEKEILMDLSNQNSGIYFIQIQNKGEALKTLKVVKY